MDFLARLGADQLAELGRSVGAPGFYETLLAAISSFLPGEFESLTIYSKLERPRVLHFEATPRQRRRRQRAEILSLYDSAFFRFDPFFGYWREVTRPGVAPLYRIADAADRDELYLTSYMPAMHLVDDMVVFLPIPGGRAVALGRERAARFRPDEIDRLERLYPLLSGLNEAHLRATGSGGIGAPAPGEGAALPAPPPLDFQAAVDSFTASGFTPREREIVRLLLAGFPNSFIAKRLAIGVGPIRNHRKRLYAKLDVTSEREIFSLFIGHLSRQEPGTLAD